MNSQIIKTSFKSLIMILFISFAVSSCKKDDTTKPATLKEQLVGNWQITSFKVGGSEYMGLIVDTASLKYAAYTGAHGNFEQTVVYTDGEQEETAGTYTIDESSKVLKMISDGEVIESTIAITNNTLEITGEEDGEVVKIKATRK